MNASFAGGIQQRVNLRSAALVAGAAAGIGEGFPFLRNELPVVAAGFQSELQNSKSCCVANLAVGLGSAKGAVIFPAGADDEFANAANRIGRAVGRLGSEALVVVVVASDDYVGVRGVERIPKRFHRQIVAMSAAGTEKGFVPVSQSASDWVRVKIGAKPLFLRRSGVASANVFAFAVYNDDVPRAEIVAVVTGLRIACGRTKIVKIRRSPGGMEFVIARRGARAGFGAAPRFVVALEVFLAAVGIGEIAHGKHRAGNFIEQLGSGFRPGEILAVGDVASTDKNFSLLFGLGGLG